MTKNSKETNNQVLIFSWSLLLALLPVKVNARLDNYLNQVVEKLGLFLFEAGRQVL
jgi:hypothetical protein